MRRFGSLLGVVGCRVMRKVDLQTFVHIENRVSRSRSWHQFEYSLLPLVLFEVLQCTLSGGGGGGAGSRRSSLLNDARHTDQVRTVGKIATLPEVNVPTTRHHDPDAITASHHHSVTDFTMSLAASRAVLRQSTFAVRRAGVRNASTTSEAAGAVKDKAAQASSKASEGLTKVSSSASSAASKVGEAAEATQAKATGMMGTVQGQ
jgi:hypothetical protein